MKVSVWIKSTTIDKKFRSPYLRLPMYGKCCHQYTNLLFRTMPIFLHHWQWLGQNLVEHCTDDWPVKTFGKMFGKAASALRSTETSTPPTAVKPGTRILEIFFFYKIRFYKSPFWVVYWPIFIFGQLKCDKCKTPASSCWLSPIVELTLPLSKSTPASDHWPLTNHVGR